MVQSGCEGPLMQMNTGQILICLRFILYLYCNRPMAPKVDSWHPPCKKNLLCGVCSRMSL